MKLNRWRVGPLFGCLTAFAFVGDALGQSASTPATSAPPDYTEFDPEQLAQITVSTANRKEQKLSEVASAMTVITDEDIRRSGATSIAEALRMAPGLNVARIDSSRWAISSRGFNDFFANKLLVLMDGRSVYTPLFSGVFWDVQDTMLEDIQQIEVIRGPGAAMWGANAVNGVINIITKSSADTQGVLVSGGGGTEELGFGSVRYGGKVNEDLTYRAYVKYFNRDDFKQFSGADGADEWDMYRGGFRSDWKISEASSLQFQGDAYAGTTGQQIGITSRTTFATTTVSGRGHVAGGNLLGAFKHVFSEDSDMSLQLYYDRTERTDMAHREMRDTYNADFQHRYELWEKQELMWGLGYRLTTDDLSDGLAGTGELRFSDYSRNDQLFSGFVQDMITLPADFKFTLGAKLEHNSYTDFEFQPNARLIWEPHEKHSIWAGVSRAVRTPARFEHTIDTFFSQGAVTGGIVGNPNYGSEELIAYELGYRVLATPKLSFDFAVFYNDYDDLRLFNLAGFFPAPPPFGVPLVAPQNRMTGETYGGEVEAQWTVTKDWKLVASYSVLEMQLHSAVATAVAPEAAEGESPHHQAQLRSYYNLPWNLQLDGSIAYVDALPARGVPGYTRVDVRLGWKPKENFELSIVGQNLLDDRHPEFGPGFLVSPNEIERSVYAKATWSF